MKIRHYQTGKIKEIQFSEWKRDYIDPGDHRAWEVLEHDKIVRLDITENGSRRFFGIFGVKHASNMIDSKPNMFVIDDKERTYNEKIDLILKYLNSKEDKIEFDSEEISSSTGISHDEVTDILQNLIKRKIVDSISDVGIRRRKVIGITTTSTTKRTSIYKGQAWLTNGKSTSVTTPEIKDEGRFTRIGKQWNHSLDKVHKWASPYRTLAWIITGLTGLFYLLLENWERIQSAFFSMKGYFIK